ncbi:YdcF family protein [Candidatus Electronema sp. PJ]|uniref:YdcF family protein n=1 Tax=Candidatus Electronema sp. PJ TaxID=3401572 RepID=UPI003AA82847
MITLARFLTPFLMPLPLGLLFLLLGLIFVLLKLRRLAIIALLASLGIFCLFGYGLPARSRLYALERQYPPLHVEKISEQQRQQIKFVVVLGSSHISDPGVPETGQLGTASLYRLFEGIRLHRELPESWLVVSGGVNQEDSLANAVVVGRTARQLGVDGGRLVIEDRPRDTVEEARFLKPLLKDAPFVLVTSAAHMRRAMQVFQDAGLKPLAAPTDFILKDQQRLSSSNLLPSCFNLQLSQQVMYEWLGSLWSCVRG